MPKVHMRIDIRDTGIMKIAVKAATAVPPALEEYRPIGFQSSKGQSWKRTA